MSIWAILLIAVAAYRLITFIRSYNTRRIISQNNATVQTVSFHWTIKAEIGTVQHEICEDAALRSIGIQGDYETFVADTVADKTEYDQRMQFASRTIRKETAKRLGVKP